MCSVRCEPKRLEKAKTLSRPPTTLFSWASLMTSLRIYLLFSIWGETWIGYYSGSLDSLLCQPFRSGINQLPMHVFSVLWKHYHSDSPSKYGNKICLTRPPVAVPSDMNIHSNLSCNTWASALINSELLAAGQAKVTLRGESLPHS